MYALDAADGAEIWKTRFSSGRPAGSPAVAYGTVFIPAGNRGGHATLIMSNGPTIGLDARTGKKVWESSSGTQGYGSPAIAGGTLVTGSQVSFVGVDVASGDMTWRVRASGQSRDFVSPAVSGGVAVGIGSICGDVIAADVQDGGTSWRTFTLEGQVSVNNMGKLGYEVLAAPAIAHGRVYVGCNDGKLHTFDLQSGERGWTFQTGGKVQSSPALAGEVLYFGSWDGRLYAVDAVEGTLLWKFRAGDRIISSPWPEGDSVYFGCDDGCLYAVRGDRKGGD
jgi:outer membrane protein assembly factor BamB